MLEHVKTALGPGPWLESLLVSWDPPLLPNGIITEYVVEASHNDHKETMLTDNSFCNGGERPARRRVGEGSLEKT